MKLKIPILKDLKGTLSRWAAEIRSIEFLTPPDFVWTNWSPTFFASGAMTVTASNVLFAKYFKIGNFLFFKIGVDLTLGGIADSYIYVTLPFRPKFINQEKWAAFCATGGVVYFGQADIQVEGSYYLRFQLEGVGGPGTWTLGAGSNAKATGFYEAF